MRRPLRHSLVATLFVLFAFSLISFGCVAKKLSEPDPFFKEWQDKAKTAQPYLPQKRSLRNSNTALNSNDKQSATENQPPEQQLSASEILMANLPTKMISVRFVGDSLPSVLRTMARLAGENILISPNVHGTIDTHIENTPWNIVFMGIIDTYGLVVKQEHNLLHVMSFQDLEEQLAKKTLQIEEEQLLPLVSKMVAVQYSTPEEIATSLRLLLSKDKNGQPRGSVSVDNHTRSVIIIDNNENINKLFQLVYELDKPTPQILLKAYIIETSKDIARELGVKWDATTSLNGDFNFATAGNFIGGGGTLGMTAIGSKMTLDMQLSALQEEGKINIISNPSIATLDNNQAVIESGTSIPYPNGVDINGNASFSVQEATLKLTVTPHVISDEMIKLDIEVQNDEVDSTRDLDGTPFLLRKNASTKLIVQNEATVVIAGLTKETSANRNNGIPFLKDMPVLGYLFKKDTTAQKFEDLLIFITPTILNQEPLYPHE